MRSIRLRTVIAVTGLAVAAIIGLFVALDARAAQTCVSTSNGGTGTCTSPGYGQVLVGKSDGTYGPIATSSLNIVSNAAFTLTTSGTSGAATYSGGVLNVPQYSGGGSSFGYPFPGNATSTNITFSNGITGNISGNAGSVTNGVYTTTFNGLFDNRLSATTSLPNILTLGNLSLPYSQLTGTPRIASTTLLGDTNTWSGNNTFSNTISGSITGNAGTATALAANGTNCAAGFYPIGIDASGNVETCTYAFATTTPWTSTGLVALTGGKGYAIASSSLFGYTPLNPTRNINTTYPLQGGGNLGSDLTLTFGGLSTSTPAVQGNIPYFSGVNTFANVATGTITCNGSASCSTAGLSVLGGNLTITGTGGSGIGLSTTSPIAAGNLLEYTAAGAGSAFGVATGTISAGSSAITVTAGRSAIGGALSIDCAGASGSQNGCLSSTDWSTFNGKDSFAWPLTPTNNFGINTNATSTALSLFNGLNASSSVRFGNAGKPQFVWDATNGFLGIASTTPTHSLSVGNYLSVDSNGLLNLGYTPIELYQDAFGSLIKLTGNPGYYFPRMLEADYAPPDNTANDLGDQEAGHSFELPTNGGCWNGNSYGCSNGIEIGTQRYGKVGTGSNFYSAINYINAYKRGAGTSTSIAISFENKDLNNFETRYTAEYLDPSGATAFGGYASTSSNSPNRYDLTIPLQVSSSTAPTLFAVDSTPRTHQFTISSTGTASTSNLILSGLGNGSSQCLHINGTGTVTGTGSDCSSGSSGAAYSFTPGVFGATLTSATSTAISDSAGFFASSTSHFTSINDVGNLNVYPTSESGLDYFVQGDGGTGIQTGAFNGSFQSLKIDGAPLLLNTRAQNKVGIGTTTPASDFSVQGNGLFSGNLFIAGLTATGTIALSGLGGVAAGSRLAVDPNGNVIATTTGVTALINGSGTACSANAAGVGSCALASITSNTVLTNQSSGNGIPTAEATSTFGSKLFGVGADGTVLTESGGVPGWTALPNSAFSFTPTTYAGHATNATSTPLQITSSAATPGLIASSSVTTYASTTQLSVGNALFDSTGAAGTPGQVLGLLNGKPAWVATSTFPGVHQSFTYATSSWTGTTTIPIEVGYGETINSIQCFPDAGTLNVQIGLGTASTSMLTASTTIGTFSYSTNNVMTAGNRVKVDIGTPASSPRYITCTVAKSN